MDALVFPDLKNLHEICIHFAEGFETTKQKYLKLFKYKPQCESPEKFLIEEDVQHFSVFGNPLLVNPDYYSTPVEGHRVTITHVNHPAKQHIHIYIR